MNLPHSRSSDRGNNGSSDHFRSPGGSGNAVRNSDDGFYDNFRPSPSNEFSREDQQFRNGTWEQHLQTPTSGFNYPDIMIIVTLLVSLFHPVYIVTILILALPIHGIRLSKTKNRMESLEAI